MKLENTLDRIHGSVVKMPSLQVFTAFTRLLLGIGFIPPSIVKILHIPFTVLPDSTPVGHYFNALYQTGFYYEFLGWGQLLAAVLLLFPRSAHIGALLFLPIILNITVLTTSVGFKGTPFITNAMFLAALYLVAWDYDRWKAILFGNRKERPAVLKHELIWLPLLFAVGGIAAAGVFFAMGLANLHQKPVLLFSMLPALGLVFGLLVAVHHRFMRTGPLERSAESR
jgi:hypothetical protein